MRWSWDIEVAWSRLLPSEGPESCSLRCCCLGFRQRRLERKGQTLRNGWGPEQLPKPLNFKVRNRYSWRGGENAWDSGEMLGSPDGPWERFVESVSVCGSPAAARPMWVPRGKLYSFQCRRCTENLGGALRPARGTTGLRSPRSEGKGGRAAAACLWRGLACRSCLLSCNFSQATSRSVLGMCVFSSFLSVS